MLIKQKFCQLLFPFFPSLWLTYFYFFIRDVFLSLGKNSWRKQSLRQWFLHSACRANFCHMHLRNIQQSEHQESYWYLYVVFCLFVFPYSLFCFFFPSTLTVSSSSCFNSLLLVIILAETLLNVDENNSNTKTHAQTSARLSKTVLILSISFYP